MSALILISQGINEKKFLKFKNLKIYRKNGMLVKETWRSVYVDFAHTPDALYNALNALDLMIGKLIIFGRWKSI